MDLIPGCGVGEFVNGNRCDACPIGTYQNKSFHTDAMCTSCSGTQFPSSHNFNEQIDLKKPSVEDKFSFGII